MKNLRHMIVSSAVGLGLMLSSPAFSASEKGSRASRRVSSESSEVSHDSGSTLFTARNFFMIAAIAGVGIVMWTVLKNSNKQQELPPLPVTRQTEAVAQEPKLTGEAAARAAHQSLVDKRIANQRNQEKAARDLVKINRKEAKARIESALAERTEDYLGSIGNNLSDAEANARIQAINQALPL